MTKWGGFLDKNPNISLLTFLFSALYLCSESFFPYVEQMDRAKDRINQRLRKRTTKEDLLALSDIETGMVYLVSSAKQNVILLEQIKGQIIYKSMTDAEKEQLEDSLIEARQLSSMTEINAQVLQQLSATYNNILNNNLNDTMTTMTILSVILAILSVITGFFGMNVPLPLSDNPFAWLFIIGGGLVIWLLVAAFLCYLIYRKL